MASDDQDAWNEVVDVMGRLAALTPDERAEVLEPLRAELRRIGFDPDTLAGASRLLAAAEDLRRKVAARDLGLPQDDPRVAAEIERSAARFHRDVAVVEAKTILRGRPSGTV